MKFYPDLSKIMYIEEIDASKVELAYNEKILGVGRHRGQILINYQRKVEVTETGEKQIKVRLYLDNKAFVRSGFKYLYWQDNYIKAGDNLVIQASDKHAIPDGTDPIDDKITVILTN